MNEIIRNAKYEVVIAICLAACLSTIALAGSKVEEFRAAAAENEGCRLIPYQDLQSSCRENYGEQRNWCTGERERGCGDLKKDDLKDREIAKERRDNASQCLVHRKYVRKIYADAVDRLRSDQDSSDNDAEVRSLAKVIKGKIEATFENHDSTIRDTERRRDTCDNVYNGR
ncbi:MAG: hypothetical protein ACRD59_16060 [Candidatus Acidiferrales bacterium]